MKEFGNLYNFQKEKIEEVLEKGGRLGKINSFAGVVGKIGNEPKTSKNKKNNLAGVVMKMRKVSEKALKKQKNEELGKGEFARDQKLREEQLVQEIKDDYLKRKEERRAVEQSWLLNMNFLVGNQFSFVTPSGEIAEYDRRSASESREVFNHIAPIVESRLAKLGRVRPTMGVRPASPSESDLETAKLSKKILESVSNSLDISNVVSDATMWSEVTGTAFYKVVWDDNAGVIVGYKGKNGEIYDTETVEKFREFSPDVINYLETMVESGYNLPKEMGNEENLENSASVFKPEKMVELTKEITKSEENNDIATKSERISKPCRIVASFSDALISVRTKFGLTDEQIVEIERILPNESRFLGLTNDLEPIFDGDVVVSVCSPFEIFPENASIFDIEEQPSIIHARAVDKLVIKSHYGVDVAGENINSVSLSSFTTDNFFSGKSNVKRVLGETCENQAIVIERWVAPCEEFPSGRLSVVAGDKLVFDGDMPYEKYPFVKQVSNRVVGDFWGVSVVERCIPIQRAYNAVKNRKLECIGRLCGGVLAVEEGSVDLDELETDGLTAGKVLVYRSGSSVPHFMDAGSVPRELSEEEERLSNELISVSGVSELMRNSTLPSQVNSGTAISLLIEQDDTRLSVTAENIRTAMLKIAKMVLSMYKKYAESKKLGKITDECGRLQVFYWSKSDISSDDIVLETSNELNESLASRKQMVLELLKYGILQNGDGKLDERTKSKVIEMLGFGNWESGADESALQISRAKLENATSDDICVLEIDNHELHIKEHTKYLLEQNGIKNNKQEKILQHIREHRSFLKMEKEGILSE